MIKADRVFEGVAISEVHGEIPRVFKSLTCDSRQVEDGSLFVALRGGASDGHDFLDQVGRDGAAAAIVDHFCDCSLKNQIIVENSLASLPRVAANFYDHPARLLKVFGITGSNGKTTTAFLLESILKTADRATALIGTIEYRYDDIQIPAPNTTPLPHEMQRILREIVDAGVKNVVMEVSSHGLALHRVDEIKFGVALFTNLSQDHLDFHKDMSHYRETKKRLFTDYMTDNGVGVFNFDDETGRQYFDEVQLKKKISFAINRDADFRARDVDIRLSGSTFTLETHFGDHFPIHTQMVGLHNVANILAAVSAAWAGGVPLDVIRKGVELMPSVPGRLESIPNSIGAQVVVDYCHTPDALEKCLHALTAIPHNRIITLFGCGGDRDKGKRPMMGEIALRFSDHVIVTSDNPRTEDADMIIKDIEAGMTAGKEKYDVIPKRKEAIKAGVAELKEGDIFLVAGKGHETYQIIGSEKTPFDDREITTDYLNQAGKGVKG